jgi:hypothetical protein
LTEPDFEEGRSATASDGDRVGLLSARRLGRYSKDCVDDIRIELHAAIAHEFFPGLVCGHRRPVRACRRIALKASQPAGEAFNR